MRERRFRDNREVRLLRRGLRVWQRASVAVATSMLVAAAFGLTGALAATPVAPFTPIVDLNTNGQSCLDVTNLSKANGAHVQQWQCTGKANQQWTLVPSKVAGYYSVRNQNSGACLDVTGASTANGTQVQQWACWEGPQQLWKPVPSFASGYFSLKNYKSGLCLDVAGSSAANGTKVQQWACWNTTGQQWKSTSLTAARQQEEAAAKKLAEEQALAKKHQEEAAAKKRQEEAAAKKRAEEQDDAKKRAEEEAAAKKRAEEQAAAEREQAAKRQEEEVAVKKREEEAKRQEVPVPAPRPRHVRVKVTVNWSWKGATTRMDWIKVGRLPRDTSFSVLYTRHRDRRAGKSRDASTVRQLRALIRWLEHKRYRAGDRLSLDINRHGYVPERATFTIRDGRQPKLTHR
jgi:hypothetical protein